MSDPEEPSAPAVRCGRIVFCVVGAMLLGVGGWYANHNPNEQVFLAAVVIGAGMLLIWLGLALPPRIVAHLGFWLPWFTH
jgi:sulfite exporter TauE/SafE